MMDRKRFALVAMLMLSIGTTGLCRAQGMRATCVTRILFLGDSYTYFNDLPAMISDLARHGNHCTIQTRMVAPGGWRLKDHWEKGTGRQLLEAEKWDFVVLQDQSTLGMNYWVDGRDHVNSDAVFRPYAEKWAAAVHAKGATPVFFLTWAGKNTPEDQSTLSYAYARVAKETRSLLIPVGMAWEAVRRDRPQIGLFYPGHGSHPSPAGSYLAACVFYAAMFHLNPLGLPSKLIGTPVNLDTGKLQMGKSATLVDLNAKDAAILQIAAWNAWQRVALNGGYPSISTPRVPAVQPLPAGLPLAAPDLDGMWKGSILFYPVGAVGMVLHVQSTHGLSARLEIRYHSKDFPDESVELSDVRVKLSRVLFSDPKSIGVDNLAVHLVGVMPTRNILQGTAEARNENAEVLGSWTLRRVTQQDGPPPQ
jgi:hypothetical protein